MGGGIPEGENEGRVPYYRTKQFRKHAEHMVASGQFKGTVEEYIECFIPLNQLPKKKTSKRQQKKHYFGADVDHGLSPTRSKSDS